MGSDQRPIDISYTLTTVTVSGQRTCDPVAGTIVYDGLALERDGFDVTNIVTETTIEKQEGERYWTVRERNLDGTVRDEHLVASLALAPFCAFPEL